MQTAAEANQDHRLTLSEVLQALVAEGLVPRADADKLIADRRLHRGDHHPLVVIADQKWRSVKPPQKVLFLERSEEHTSELQSRSDLVCRLLLEKKKHTTNSRIL